MTTQLIQELTSTPNIHAYHQITPPEAKAVAVAYFREAIKAMIQQFHAADIHSHLIVTQGIPEGIPNRDEYLKDPFRTAKRLDFLYPDAGEITLYDDNTLMGELQRERIYTALKEKHRVFPLMPMSYAATTKWIDRAINEALNVHRQRLDHEVDIKISDAYFDNIEELSASSVQTDATQPKKLLFSEAVNLYLGETKRTLNIGLKTVMKKESCYKLWQETMGDISLHETSKRKASDFKLLLLKAPSNITKRYKGKKITELDLDAIPMEQRLSPVTINGVLRELATLFNWCKNNGHYEGENPFSGVFVKVKQQKAKKRQPFKLDQLKTVFSLPLFKGCGADTQRGRYIAGSNIFWDNYYWVPLIALYTGARMQEICQLSVDDIHPHDNGHYFSINDDGDDKFLKNDHSKRNVPIHPELIRLGLMDYVRELRAKGQSKLFPDIPQGSRNRKSEVFTKRFAFLLRQKAKIKDRNVCFHSFRHTVIDAYRNIGTPEYIIRAITGHIDGRLTAHDGYGAGASLDALFNAVEQLDFDLELPKKQQ